MRVALPALRPEALEEGAVCGLAQAGLLRLHDGGRVAAQQGIHRRAEPGPETTGRGSNDVKANDPPCAFRSGVAIAPFYLSSPSIVAERSCAGSALSLQCGIVRGGHLCPSRHGRTQASVGEPF